MNKDESTYGALLRRKCIDLKTELEKDKFLKVILDIRDQKLSDKLTHLFQC